MNTTENTFKRWEDYSEKEQLLCVYSDTFKEAHGMRPRGAWVMEMTVEQLKEAIESLGAMVARDMERERQNEIEHEEKTALAMTRQEWTLGAFWSQAVK